MWGVENETHDFTQTLSQLLNNNASIADVTVTEQSYTVKSVIVTVNYNKKAGGATVSVKVGGTTFGSAQTINSDTTTTFTYNGASAVKGQVVVSSVNNCGSGTGKGTFKITNVRLVEGPAAAPAYTITATRNNDSYGTVKVSGTTITATPAAGYRVMAGNDGYTVTSGTATVVNNGDNTFTVTPSSNCTVQINFEAIPTYTVTLKDDGDTRTQASAGASVTLPARAGCAGYTFAGWTKTWVTDQTEWTTTAPTIIPAGSYTPAADENLYPVYTKEEGGGEPVETKTQTFQYDTWTKGGSSTDKSSYRLFHNGGYVESASDVDFSKLSKVIVYGGTFGGTSYNGISIKKADGTLWKNATVSGTSQTGTNTITGGESLTGSSKLRVYSTCGKSSSNGVRISKVEVYTMEGGTTTYYISEANCCSLQAATSVRVTSVAATSVTLGWTAPSSTTGITKLQVVDGNGTVKVDNLAANATSATVTGLTECESYSFHIVSVGSSCNVSSASVPAQPYSGAKTVTYNYHEGEGTGSPASFTTDCSHTSTTLPTPTRANYRFDGWYTSASGGTRKGGGGDSYTPDATIELHAQWTRVYTVSYDYAGGSGSCVAGGPYAEGETVTVCASTPTKDGSTFKGWSYSPSVTVTAGTFPMPASNVTITATWQDTEYTLTHYGSNYTNTENQTRIKSGDTPLTLNYTCTGTYGFPSDVTISGGGKGTWTKDTHYTWTVAGNKQSARLVINETTITADVAITITMSTLYTVTFVHHSKGTYSDGSTEWSVRSDENVITLPTVTDVSCGFYDTFEGWITGSEYAESSDKPATVYAGGSSYTVMGDVTLRALYSKCEGAGGSVYRKVTAIGDVTNGTYILVSNNSTTPYVYSGHTGSNNYGDIVSGLINDGDDYSSTLPSGAVPVTIAKGTETHISHFTIKNGTKYFKAGSDIALQDTESWWQLTDGSKVSSKACPAGALQPVNSPTYVMQEYSSNRFKTYTNTQSYYVFLYKLIDKCTKYYATNPSCVKPTGVHITYNANGGEMTCSNQNKTYKVVDAENQYPQLASVQDFCTNATRTGYTLVGWNTQANGLGTTYNINQHYYNLPVSGELGGDNWVTLNLYAMWAPAVSFNLGNATGGTGVPAVVEADGGFMLPAPTDKQLGVIPCGYSFYGWSESSVVATNTKPALFMPGTKYTGGARTLYAVYRKSEGGVNPDLFSLSYMYNSTKYYVAAPTGITTAPSTWNYDKAAKFSASTNEEDAVAFGMKTNADYSEYKEIYWVYDGDEEEKAYLSYDGGANITFKNEEDTYYLKWTITGTTTLTFLHSEGRYLSGDGTEIGCPSSAVVISFTKEEASATTYTYATNPNCFTKATLTFVTNGGTLNYPDTYTSSNYEDLDVPTTVKLPTATFAGEWEFEGWRKGSAVPSQSEPVSGANFYEVTLNTTTYTADVAGETIFYAVYSKTINEKPFDPNNEGTYKLFAIMADGTKKYMPTWDGTQKTLSPVTNCAATGDYTITPGTGEHAGQYKITHGNYTLGVVGESDTQFKNVADTWWDIENSTSNKGTWRIKVHGSSERAMYYNGSFFGNYKINELNRPGQTGYRDMEIGECIYTEYTSTPENIPYITITGSPVKITSTNGERVYAPTKLHIEAHNFSTTRTIHFAATNGFATNPASVNTGANGAYSGDIDIYYQPTSDGDGSIVSSVLTASQTAGPAAEKVSQTFSAIRGRNMPANFVIAAKVGEQWYAMPDDCRSSGTPAGVPIEVNDPNAPTAASLVPHNVEWRLSDVVNSNSRPKDKVYFYEPNSTNNYTLYAGAAPSIQTNAQLSNVTGGNSNNYEWGLTTTDLCAYTISNDNVGKNISINTSGNFGTHAANIASSTLYLLPITAYYETAQMQVLEWKANSVVIMYTGTQATATTKVGDNSASSAQTLSSQKLTHGIYELTTSQALTANAGQPLKVSFGGGAEIAIVTIPIIINSAITANADHASEDVIIVSGGKLTAAATKYNFRNIYVYGGGKLKMASESQLGVNNIILRAGGVTTNGSGGSATYAYVYPQVELGGTLSSTQTNIKYEYVTDYDHWYHLCLPFNALTSTIQYPQEYYGSNVAADNHGSWVIKRYDGATRATGNYDAWVDIESNGEPTPTTVTAGHGYIFWGAPKKVSVGGGTATRQTWGIQRMTMSVAADAAKTAENADKNVSVAAHSGAGSVNDKGWNLVGNPYMVNLTAFSSDNLKQGQLVHSDAVPWDGKWKNDGTGTRYVTIPDNHFDTYEAKTTATASGAGDFMPGRVFFVQIEKGTTLTFEATNRAALAPAWYRNTEAEQPVDVETGIVMSSETLADEVNFWIKDSKTEAYEFNADYPKTPNKTNFNIYGVHQSGNLSWVAISPAIAEGDMAIGYQVPAAGDYTLSLSEKYIAEEIESVFVTDHGVSPELTTDLMVNTYTFTVHQAETNNERFTVSIKVREEDNIATDIGNSTVDTHAVKFIRDDKMYILRNGLLYDATGKRVNVINK